MLFVGAMAGATAMLVHKAGIHEDLDWESVPKPGHLIDIDGYQVHYLDQGQGPAIVLIHGFGGQTYSYRHLIPMLARDHRVIAVDLKGYGYSERNAHAGLSHTAQVAMLKGLLDKLGVARATFVGHSMGGAVAQRFAVTYPDMADALILAASVSGEDRAHQTRFAARTADEAGRACAGKVHCVTHAPGFVLQPRDADGRGARRVYASGPPKGFAGRPHRNHA